MRKIISVLLLGALALASLVFLPSCHGRAADSLKDSVAAFDDSKHYEITFWAKNDNNKTQQDVYKQAVADFERLYPNIDVHLKLYSDYKLIDRDVTTNIQSGTTPNICITYPDYISNYLEGDNLIVPLDNYMTDSRYGFGGSELRFDGPDSDELVDRFMGEGVINGAQYAIPYMRSTEALYINKTYVERLLLELGYGGMPEVWTWDLIWEVSEKALEKDSRGNYKINGKQELIPFIYKSTDNMMITLLRQKGLPYTNDDGDVFLFSDDTGDILKELHHYASVGAFSTFGISSYPGNWFNRGCCLFAIDSTAGATWMGSDAPLMDIDADEVVDFETEVVAIPQYDPESPRMISQGPSVCIFNKDDAGEVLASWLFTQFLLTNEVQIAYSKTEGYIPVTEKAYKSPEYLDYLLRAGEDNTTYYDVKIAASEVFLDNIDNTFVTSVFPGSSKVREAAGYLIERTCRSAQSGKTATDAAVESLYKETINRYKITPAPPEKFPERGDNSVSVQLSRNDGMPPATLALVIALPALWLGIGGYVLYEWIKKRKKHS